MMVTVELIQVTCCQGCIFAISKDLYDYAHRRGREVSINCPLGHNFFWPIESEAAKIERLQLEVQRKDNELARERQEKERLKRRLHAGLCPFCKRSFLNVARHMACKHKIIDVNGRKLLEAKR